MAAKLVTNVYSLATIPVTETCRISLAATPVLILRCEPAQRGLLSHYVKGRASKDAPTGQSSLHPHAASEVSASRTQ